MSVERSSALWPRLHRARPSAVLSDLLCCSLRLRGGAEGSGLATSVKEAVTGELASGMFLSTLVSSRNRLNADNVAMVGPKFGTA